MWARYITIRAAGGAPHASRRVFRARRVQRPELVRRQLIAFAKEVNYVQNTTNCNWQLDFMIVIPVRNHCQLMVVTSLEVTPAAREPGGG